MPSLDWKRCGNTPFWKIFDPDSGFTMFINMGEGLLVGWQPYRADNSQVSVQTVQLSADLPPDLVMQLLVPLPKSLQDWLGKFHDIVESLGGLSVKPPVVNNWLASLPKEQRDRHLTLFMGLLSKIGESVFTIAPGLEGLIVTERVVPREELDETLGDFGILECD